MAFETHIPNIESYNIEMRKSLIDKVFFLDKINANIIVDYGCADGALGSFINVLFPEIIYVGYDISEEMIEIAKKNVPNGNFFSDYDQLVKFVQSQNGITAVVLNSIIHEVYSYGSKEDVDNFWNRVYDAKIFNFVVIRDMSVSRTASRLSDSISVIKVKKNVSQRKLEEFEAQWGSINENWSLTHFLLKYRYEINWEREVKENYLPVSLEDLIQKAPNNFEPIFYEHFTLPYIREQIKKDFNIELQERTHVKLIYKVTNV